MQMSDRKQMPPAPSAEELHAYLDGALPAEQVARIEAYLAAHPDEAMRVEMYRLQDARMRAVFDAPRADETPEALQELAGKLSRTVKRHHRIRSTARHTAVVALCVAAAAAGRVTADYPIASDSTVVAQSRYAADAFRLVTNHPDSGVLDQSAGPAELGGWLTQDGDKVRIPRLQALGFTPVGGQVLPTGAGPAVQIVYNDEKKGPFSLYVARAPECERTTPRFTRDSDISLLSWCRDRVVYMLIGRLDQASMMWIMDAVAHPDPHADEVQPDARKQVQDMKETENRPQEDERPQLQPAVVRDGGNN